MNSVNYNNLNNMNYMNNLNNYNKLNMLNNPNMINNQNKSESFFDVLSDHKWSIAKAIFYSMLFYFFTSPNLIELTETYIPRSIGVRLAHTILFGLFYLLLNWKN